VGDFKFIKISTIDNITLQVTANHMVVIEERGIFRVKSVKTLQIGDVLITPTKISVVKGVEEYWGDTKCNLVTEHGTVVAQNIFVTTICEDFGSENSDFNNTISLWRETHGYSVI